MTQAVYILGGAGAGKSTFTENLMQQFVAEVGPLEDLHSKRNKKALVTLRGHECISEDGAKGMYLGVIREKHPGTDGLDRASSPVGEEWLDIGSLIVGEMPDFIIAEGATLMTTRFLNALQRNTDLLLVHLFVDDVIADLRFAQRGTTQNDGFVKATRTRSANRFNEMIKDGAWGVEADTAVESQWEAALQLCVEHLSNSHGE